MSTPQQVPVSQLNRVPTYTTIPTLKQLMPKTGGLAGVEYLQCAAQNISRAAQEGWLQVHGAMPYNITNPNTGHTIAVMLLAKGKPIPGVSYLSGGRQCQVDLSIDEVMTEPPKAQPKPTKDPT